MSLIVKMQWKFEHPGRTVRADIRLDIRNITDVRVELSVQPRISAVNCASKSVAPKSAWISAGISVLRISEREVYHGYPWLYGQLDTDIRNFTDTQADIRTDSSTRTVRTQQWKDEAFHIGSVESGPERKRRAVHPGQWVGVISDL